MGRPIRVGPLALAFVVLVFLGHMWAAEQCVKVRVTNCFGRTVTVAYGPVTLCAETRVMPDEQHRTLVTTWDYAPPEMLAASDRATDSPENAADDPSEPEKQNGAIGSSERSLDGERERIRHDTKLNGLSGGMYEVISTVYRDESRKKVCGRATARVMVQ